LFIYNTITMKILSIDVGIKNLAFCLFDKSQDKCSILKWDVLNLIDDQIVQCSLCTSPAKFKKHDACYCLKHAKKQPYLIPTKQQKLSSIHKLKLASLYELANGYNMQYDPKIKKAELVALINQHIQTAYFETIDTKKTAEIDLCTIGQNIKTKFNMLFQEIDTIDHVIIENQIGPIAVRMKTIQGMLVQYFVMSHLHVTNIEFVSASNKLKDCDSKDIENYKDRKKRGIQKCLGILKEDGGFAEYMDHFNAHKKKDDLSDSFLQGLWFIHSKNL